MRVSTAAALADTLRISDIKGRYGGDELIALLPHVDLAGAAVCAERIRVLLGGLKHPVSGGTIRVTCCVGAAQLCEGDDPDGLIQRADMALYEAKAAGRDRIALAPPLTPPQG